MLTRILDNSLCALHGDRTLCSNKSGELDGARHGRGLVGQHGADKADGQRLGGCKDARRQAHVLDPRERAAEFGEACECANVGRQTYVDLLDLF